MALLSAVYQKQRVDNCAALTNLGRKRPRGFHRSILVESDTRFGLDYSSLFPTQPQNARVLPWADYRPWRTATPFITESVNMQETTALFSIGLRGHQIPPLVYSCSRRSFHYAFSFPSSQSHERRIHYCAKTLKKRSPIIKLSDCLFHRCFYLFLDTFECT